jgi:hypothetical protein
MLPGQQTRPLVDEATPELLFCVVFTVIPHGPRAAQIGGY